MSGFQQILGEEEIHQSCGKTVKQRNATSYLQVLFPLGPIRYIEHDMNEWVVAFTFFHVQSLMYGKNQ